MYIVEKLIQLIQKRLNPPPKKLDVDEAQSCEHVFLPIDSTKEYLACYNCGLVVKSKDMKDLNFFKHPK